MPSFPKSFFFFVFCFALHIEIGHAQCYLIFIKLFFLNWAVCAEMWMIEWSEGCGKFSSLGVKGQSSKQGTRVRVWSTVQDPVRPHKSGRPKNPLFKYSVNTVFKLQIRLLKGTNVTLFLSLFSHMITILYMKINHRCSEDAAPSVNYSCLYDACCLASSGRSNWRWGQNTTKQYRKTEVLKLQSLTGQ